MTDTLSLKVNGKAFGGWKTARVTRGIETVAGTFALSVSERWANQSEPWPLRDGDECELVLNGVTVITGFIDKRELSYDSSGHTVSVEGRDKTGDLVDCSANLTKWEYNNFDVYQLAQKLCGPLGVDVSLQSGLVPTKAAKLSVTPGDTAFDALEHACRLAGLIPVSDGTGGLLLTRTGSARCETSLVQGENILAAKGSFDVSGRFHRYRVLGQHHGTDKASGSSVAHVKGEATDQGIERIERVLIVRPEHDVTKESAKKRAQWEAITRAARGEVVSVTVQGWNQPGGALWPVNALVRVKSPLIGVDGDLLITQATYSVDDSAGTTTTLSLKRPDSFKPEPTIQKSSSYWPEIVRGV